MVMELVMRQMGLDRIMGRSWNPGTKIVEVYIPRFIRNQDNVCTICTNELEVNVVNSTRWCNCSWTCYCGDRSDYYINTYTYTCTHCQEQPCDKCHNTGSIEYINGVFYCEDCHNDYKETEIKKLIEEFSKINTDPSTDDVRYSASAYFKNRSVSWKISEVKCGECNTWNPYTNNTLTRNDIYYCSAECISVLFSKIEPNPSTEDVRYSVSASSRGAVLWWKINEVNCDGCNTWIQYNNDILSHDKKYYCSINCASLSFSNIVPNPSTDTYQYKLNYYKKNWSWVLSKIPCSYCEESIEVNSCMKYGSVVSDTDIPRYCTDTCKWRHVNKIGPYLTIDSNKVYGWTGRNWVILHKNICNRCSGTFYTKNSNVSTICHNCSDSKYVKITSGMSIPVISQIKYFGKKRHTWGHPKHRHVNDEQFDYRCPCISCR